MPEQLSFLPTPEFAPLLPPSGSKAEQALIDMLEHEYITQIDWLRSGKGWRLSAAVKALDYLGWEPTSMRVLADGWGVKIARYSLPTKAKQAAYKMRKGGHAE